jgi:ribosomal protein L17
MQETLTRYRVLEIFAETVRDLEAADGADLEKLIAKIKRKAKKALDHKGAPRNENLGEARVKALASTKRKAKAFRLAMLPLIAQAKASGAGTTRQIADWLNDQGHLTARGFAWSSAAVHRIITADDE